MYILQNARRSLFAGAVMVTLAACGGGGGGGTSAPAPTPPASVPLAAAIAYGSNHAISINMSISGTVNGVAVTGSASYTEAAAVATTFKGAPALSQALSVTGSVTGNGQTFPYSSTGVGYENSSYQAIGYQDSTTYEVAAAPFSYPATVSVGDTGQAGIYQKYSDVTMNTPTGTEKDSYIVQADPASSTDLIVVYVAQNYDTGNNLTGTTNTYFKITTAGVPSLSSVTVQSTSGSLTFTAQ